MNATILRRGGLVVVALLMAMSACDRAFLHDPADERMAALTIELTSAAGGPAEAFDKADRAVIRFFEGERLRLERTVNIAASGRDVAVPLQVELKRPSETLRVEVELRRTDAPLFRGSTSVQLRVGRRNTAPVALEAVAHGIALPDSLPTFDVYGDTIRVPAATIFATGDTLAIESVEEWTTLNSTVVDIRNALPVVLADGQAQLVGRVGASRDTMTVRVHASVSHIVIDPPVTNLPIGTAQQYTASLFDRRGNRISGRTVVWGSTDTMVVRITAQGMATGVGPGTATITAASDPQVASLSLTALPGPPAVVTDSADQITTTTAVLRATVKPNGAATELWFELDTDSLFPAPDSTTVLPPVMDAGQLRLSVGQLAPGTTYYVRGVARNLAGRVTGNIQRFTTVPAALHVRTGAVQNVTATSATIRGEIIPGLSPAEAWVQWSTTPDFSNALSTAPQPLVPSLGSVPLAVSVVGLSPNTTYYYRVVGRNAGGTVFGATLSFATTTGTPGTPAPQTTTLAASSITANGAVLNGSVNPSGSPTSAWFEWGTDPDLNTFTQTTPDPVGNGTSGVALPAPIGGLLANTTYYFRVAASNGGGTSRGGIDSFTTPPGSGSTPPAATTLSATPVFSDSARLNGSINPNGEITNAWFEWGSDPLLANFASTAPQVVGSGNVAVAVDFMLKGLTPNTTYYFRIVGSSAVATSKGAILSFTTTPAVSPTAPTAVTLAADPVVADAAVANGLVNAKGIPTTVWFEWGSSPTLTSFNTTLLQSAGSGNTEVGLAELMEPLTPGATYYYRVVAANTNNDTTRGAIVSFRAEPQQTAPPIATTLQPSNEGFDTATMNGSANPQGSSAVVWFEWGTSPTLTSFRRTVLRPIGSGGTTQVSETLTGITRPPRIYYYRVVVMNGGGTSRGAIVLFELR